MRDYVGLVTALRYCSTHVCNKECGYYEICHRDRGKEYPSVTSVGFDAADAIEELLARVSENDWRVCENCSLQHLDTDGMRWCEELSMVVGGNFYCGFFEGSEPSKGVE